LNKILFVSLFVFSSNSIAEENKRGEFVFRTNIPQLCGMDIVSSNGGIKLNGIETSQVEKGTAKFYNNSKDNVILIESEVSSKKISNESLRKGYIVFIIRGVEVKFPINGGEMNLVLSDDKNVSFFIDFTNLDITELSSGDIDLSLKFTILCR